MESIAMCEEGLLEEYLESGEVQKEGIRQAIQKRNIFPCFFGSALKVFGVEEFLKGMEEYMISPEYGEQFGAKVYKIARDSAGNRLTYCKITGGSLKVKTILTNKKENFLREQELWEEKVDQIRIYSGTKYELVNEVNAGTICAITGLDKTYITAIRRRRAGTSHCME